MSIKFFTFTTQGGKRLIRINPLQVNFLLSPDEKYTTINFGLNQTVEVIGELATVEKTLSGRRATKVPDLGRRSMGRRVPPSLTGNHAGAQLPQAPARHFGDAPPESERDQINQNIDAVLGFYAREAQKVSRSHRILERISGFIGQPVFLGAILLFVVLWVVANTVFKELGAAEFDPAPFFWLQGIVGLSALLTATAVLSKQNRLAKLEEQRAHLDLKVTLLTEQKATQLIDLLEELRRDLPNVKNRLDSEVAALQQGMNPDLVLAALDERSAQDEWLKDPEGTGQPVP